MVEGLWIPLPLAAPLAHGCLGRHRAILRFPTDIISAADSVASVPRPAPLERLLSGETQVRTLSLSVRSLVSPIGATSSKQRMKYRLSSPGERALVDSPTRFGNANVSRPPLAARGTARPPSSAAPQHGRVRRASGLPGCKRRLSRPWCVCPAVGPSAVSPTSDLQLVRASGNTRRKAVGWSIPPRRRLPALESYRELPPPPPPALPCGIARSGWPALPPAAELVVMVSAPVAPGAMT